jgi:hypothetical protein
MRKVHPTGVAVGDLNVGAATEKRALSVSLVDGFCRVGVHGEVFFSGRAGGALLQLRFTATGRFCFSDAHPARPLSGGRRVI